LSKRRGKRKNKAVVLLRDPRNLKNRLVVGYDRNQLLYQYDLTPDTKKVVIHSF